MKLKYNLGVEKLERWYNFSFKNSADFFHIYILGIHDKFSVSFLLFIFDREGFWGRWKLEATEGTFH